MSENAQEWMHTNFPVCQKVDVAYTFEMFPNYVRKWIMETWTKVSDENGGTYTKINKDLLRPPKLERSFADSLPLHWKTDQ